MELLAQFIRTFLCGGVLCLIGRDLDRQDQPDPR